MTYALDGNQYVGVAAGSTILTFSLRLNCRATVLSLRAVGRGHGGCGAHGLHTEKRSNEDERRRPRQPEASCVRRDRRFDRRRTATRVTGSNG